MTGCGSVRVGAGASPRSWKAASTPRAIASLNLAQQLPAGRIRNERAAVCQSRAATTVDCVRYSGYHRARALPRLVEKFPIFPSFALVLGSAIGICKRGPIEGGHGALYQVKRYSMYDLALLPFEFGR